MRLVLIPHCSGIGSGKSSNAEYDAETEYHSPGSQTEDPVYDDGCPFVCIPYSKRIYYRLSDIRV